MVLACNPNTWEIEVGGSEVQALKYIVSARLAQTMLGPVSNNIKEQQKCYRNKQIKFQNL